MERPFSSHDNLILFGLMNFDSKQLSPTDSWHIFLASRNERMP
jgi:hypothetical protein